MILGSFLNSVTTITESLVEKPPSTDTAPLRASPHPLTGYATPKQLHEAKIVFNLPALLQCKPQLMQDCRFGISLT